MSEHSVSSGGASHCFAEITQGSTERVIHRRSNWAAMIVPVLFYGAVGSLFGNQVQWSILGDLGG